METAIFLVSPLLVTGWPTAYQEDGVMGGFTDLRLAPDGCRIMFSGNVYTPAECTQDFALLRACELVLQNGSTCFALPDQRQGATTRIHSASATAHTMTYGNIYTTSTIAGSTFCGLSDTNARSATSVFGTDASIFSASGVVSSGRLVYPEPTGTLGGYCYTP